MRGDEHFVQRGGRAAIGRQVVLPFSRAFEIAWKSIRLRIWRSLITMSGIVLAIAFLMSVWVSGAFLGALQRVPENTELGKAVQDALRRQAVTQENVEVRVGVLRTNDPTGAYRKLRDALLGGTEFSAALLPVEPGPFRERLSATSSDERFDALIVTEIPEGLGGAEGRRVIEDFVKAGGALIAVGADPSLPAALAGLLPAEPTGETVTGRKVEVSRHNAVLDALWKEHPETTYVQARAVDEGKALASIDGHGILWLAALGKGYVFWCPVSGRLQAAIPAVDWLADKGLLAGMLRWAARDKFSGGVAAKRDLWLVSLSLLVCIVGITNAMLMSVTERFREIGTMKCLGALDKFVVRLFLIESSLMGAAGSILGVLLGFVLSLGRALFSYRITIGRGDEEVTYWLALKCFPGLEILMWTAVALALGITLSVIAAIYPAYRAARMEPVEAMRVDA